MPDDRHTMSTRAPSAVSVSLRLLGAPALLAADGSIRALERRAAGLLALVVLEPGVTRARAAALLWPESDNARQALRQQLARFRKNYGAQLIDGDDALTLAPDVAVDLAADLATDRSADPPRPPAAALLGELAFDDCEDFAAWLAQQRARLRGGVAAELSQRIAQAEADGELDRAAQLAEQLVLADNDSESHHRTLMRLHYLRGDIAQAQSVYERLVRQLAQRFGARPSAETEQLARALRAAQAGGVVPAVTAPSRPVPVTVLRPPRMIGRARELAALGTAWTEGRAALLMGEPGLGKSRLLAEFAAGRRVLGVQGRPGDAGVPYATLSRLLRTILDHSRVELPPPRRTELSRLLPELAPTLPLPADGQRLLLQGAVEAVLAQASGDDDGDGIEGLIVDDLHFADEASVEMLQALICGSGAAASTGLRWALAQRPGEGSAAAAALRAALEEAQSLDVLPLSPLTVEEMAALIDSLGLPELDSAQLAPPLTRHTGGNPLYALETLKQGLASGVLQQGRLPTPTNIGALIERRLKQLSERALSLARVAAIAGVDFSIALAEDVMGVRAVELADAWAELEAAQVLREQAFAHDLVHDAVLRSVPAAIGRHLHSGIAHWLAARDGEPSRVARHFLAAGQPRDAAPFLWQAAQRARAALRNAEAADMLDALARIHADQGQPDEAFKVLDELRTALSYVDDRPRKQAVLTRMEALATTPARRAEAALGQARQAFEERRLDQAIAHAQRALDEALRARDADLTGRARVEIALVHSEAGRPTEALAQLQLAHDWGAEHPVGEHCLSWHHTRAWACMVAEDFDGSVRAFERCLVVPGLREDRAQYASVLGNVAVVLARQGAMAAALRYDEQRRSLLEPHEVGGSTQNYLELNAALLLGMAGRWREALTYFERAQQRGVPDVRMLHARWAHAWLQLGQHARAQRHAELALATEQGHPLVRMAALLTRAQTQLAQGLPAADLANVLSQSEALATADGSRAGRVRLLLARAELASPGKGLAPATEAMSLAAAGGLRGLQLAAATLLVEHALAAGATGGHAAPTAEAAGLPAVASVARGEALTDAAGALATLIDDYQSDVVSRSRSVLARARLIERDDAARADACVQQEAARLTALAASEVPEPFRDAFLNRNPVHRALRHWSARLVLQPRLPSEAAPPPLS